MEDMQVAGRHQEGIFADRPRIINGVEAAVAVDQVVAGAADEMVVAVLAVQLVVAGAAEEDIAAVAAVDNIVAVAAADQVVAVAAVIRRHVEFLPPHRRSSAAHTRISRETELNKIAMMLARPLPIQSCQAEPMNPKKQNERVPNLDVFAIRLGSPGAAWTIKVTRGAASVQS